MNDADLERKYFLLVQKGDKDAFKCLFDMYVDPLYAYALGYCRDQYMAEDFVQEAFVRFWTVREKISYSESIYGYLQRTVRNLCINQQARGRVEEKYRQEVLNSEYEGFCWDDDDALEELRGKLLDAIDRLPEKCREIFVKSCVEGLKYSEVADELGVSVNTIKTQVRFAYKKLRSDLNVTENGLFFLLIILLK